MTKSGIFDTSLERNKGMGRRTMETSAQRRGEQRVTCVRVSGQSMKWFSLSERPGPVNSAQTSQA